MSRLILLAAGMGKRMDGAGDGVPKPLLRLPSGRTVIESTLSNAFGSGVVDRATVVTGYLTRLMEREVRNGRRAGKVDTIFNPFYASAGPLGSIWAVREVLETEDVMLGNGDTLFAGEVFRALHEAPGPDMRLAYSRRSAMPDDVKVNVDVQHSVRRVGKGLDEAAVCGASAGLLAVRGEGARRALVRCLDEVMRDGRGGERGMIWHDLVNQLVDAGHGVRAVQVDARLWHEVDTVSDYESLLERMEENGAPVEANP